MKTQWLWWVGLMSLVAGCSSGDPYQTASAGTGRKGSAGDTATVGASSTTSGAPATTGAQAQTGTTSGTTGGSTSSGGTTSGTVCAGDVGTRPLSDCPSGTVELLGQLADYCNSNAPFNGMPEVINTLDGTTAMNLSCGYFAFCVAPGTTVNATITAPNYLEVLLPSVTVEKNDFYPAIPGIAMVCSNAGMGFVEELMSPPFNVNLAMVLIEVESVAGLGTPCNPLSGWQFTMILPDGGSIVPAQAQVSGSGFDLSATATLGSGSTLFYNLDPSLNGITFTANNPGLEEAGTVCENLSQSTYALSPVIPMQGGAVTYVPYVVE